MDMIHRLRPDRPAVINLLLAVSSALLLLTVGCAHHMPIALDGTTHLYYPGSSGATLIERFAPAFMVYDAQQPHNRIGRPWAEVDNKGCASIRIDPEEAVVFTQQIPFATVNADYTNLVYRIHFPKVPFDLAPFNLTAGRNAGILVVMTVDRREKLVLVTTVGTCGCYKALVPTTHLDDKALPDAWPPLGDRIAIYGEQLPARLDFNALDQPRLLVHLRPDVHRVMNLEVTEDKDLAGPGVGLTGPYRLAPAASLWQLPTPDGTVSMFHEDGILKGHVKGAIKPLETLLLSWLSFDLFVGMDKAYADTGNPFYTSLKPWNRERSDMWHFERFLTFWGWRL
jgi:hypothetical protein